MAELSKRQDKIIKHLKESNRPVTGKELSEIIGVSARTIRSDIESIKASIPDLIKASRQHGYYIDNSDAVVHSVLEEIKPNERLILLVKKMTVNDAYINLYDIAEEMFVSESTILSDIKEIKRVIANSNIDVEFQKNKDEFRIVGDFESKVNMFMHFLGKYYSPMNIYQLNSIFTDTNLDELINRVVKILLENDFFSRYLSLDTVIVNLLLIKERSMYETKSDSYSDEKSKITEELLDLITDETNKEYIENYNYIIINGIRNIAEMERIELDIRNRNIEESEFYNTFLTILNEVEEMYHVDFLSNRKYFLDLIIHANIAVYRVQKNISITNPLKGQMKMEYPFLFDIAFYISNRIEEEMGTRLPNEEVSFIVTHLINSFEDSQRGTTFDSKVNVYLITLEGSSISKYIIDRIKILTNPLINIKTISSIYDLKHNEHKIREDDVIISTTPIFINGEQSNLIISPQVTVTDEFKINTTISKNIENKKISNFESMFDKFFNEKFIYFDAEFENREEAIEEISRKFVEENYIDESYIESIQERESLLSTSLPTGIALPHATKFDAHKSGVAICFPKKKMKWGEFDVSMIMLFVIASDDKQYLNEFYGLVAEFSASNENIREVLNKKTFKSLKDKLLKFYMERK